MNNKGQAMIEVAIALAIAVIVITALLSSVISSLDSAQYSRDLNDATQYSQEGLEIVRTITTTFTPGSYCLGTTSPFLTRPTSACSTPNVGIKFIRRAELRKNSGNCSGLNEVTVTTAWADGKCTSPSNRYCHVSSQTSCVSNL